MKSAFTRAFLAMGILLGIVHLIYLHFVMILDLNIIILILRMLKLQIRKIRQFNTHFVIIVVVQLLRNVILFVTPWTAAHQASFLSFTISQSLLKLMSIKLVVPSNHLILCHPLLLLPSIFPSIMVFSNELVLCIGGQSIRASSSASVLPMNIQG